MFGRRKVARLVAEFLGTATLALVLLAVVRSAVGLPYFIAIAVGITNALLILVFGAISGAHVNPIVTLGLWTLRKINTLEAVAYIAMQFAGALVAWRLFTYLINDSLPSVAGNGFDWRVLLAEAFGAVVYGFGVATAIYQRQSEGVKAATVGLSLTFGLMIASAASNAVLNPALAVSVQSWSLAYIVGPLAGSIVGMNLYGLLFAPAIETASEPVTPGIIAKVTRRKVSRKK